jgi:thiopeptide-type bacteriocin biosynthesis protein
LGRGEFTLTVVGMSRGMGTMTGRFIDLLAPADRQRVADAFAGLPVSDPDALAVQLSFPPLVPGTAHVTRAPALLPVLSLAEHHTCTRRRIRLDDLAVGCDGQRLYLASLSLGRRVEPTILHALDPRGHTPPLARFLAEVGKAHNVVVSGLGWGAASCLPFLPRLRYRRTVLSPARWLLDPADLPAGAAAWPEWDRAFGRWRDRRRLPRLVCLTEADQRLNLDLEQTGHRVLLRTHLDSARRAVLVEAAAADAYGWFGGRAHEIVVPLVAPEPDRLSRPRALTRARLIGRDHGHAPGASRWLFAKLYGHPGRQTEILAAHLPRLLSQWSTEPAWWFMRYGDPEPHLRLRVALTGPDDFGTGAYRVSVWAARLRMQGLLREVRYASYYPEVGRWGAGPALASAEEVFGADSRALLAQFAQPALPQPQALAAAHFVAIVAGFTGSVEAGTRWLIEHGRTDATPAPARPLLEEAVALADTSGDWAALRAAPGGDAVAATFAPRAAALARYRARLADAEGIDPDEVLASLLHAHHIRAAGIDRDGERTCMHLARAAALAFAARSGRSVT